jgi:hypothetical protein
LYYFHKKVWPKEDGGEDWLVPPAFLSKVVEGGDRSKGKDSISAALKMRKKGKGKKLGS